MVEGEDEVMFMKGSYADQKWRQEVKARDGYRCRMCGSRNRLEAHHVFGRGNQGTRHDLDNGVTLCEPHHRYAHGFKPQFLTWAERELGTERFRALRAKSLGHKIVPRRLPDEDVPNGPAPAGTPPSEQRLRDLVMAIITMENTASPVTDQVYREWDELGFRDLWLVSATLAGITRALLSGYPDPEKLRADLALMLHEESIP